MKYIISFAIVFIFQILSFGQNGFINKDEAKNIKTDGLKQGKWIEYLKFNKAWIEIKECNKDTADYYRLAIYKDNQITGTEYINYITGEPMNVTQYSNGIKNGVGKGFYKTGGLLYENYYVNGLLQGLSKMYYESGKLISEMLIIDNIPNGPYKTYHESGAIASEVLMINGKLNGTSKHYDQTGLLTIEMFYLNNKRTGETKVYNKDGVLSSIQSTDSLGNIASRQFNVQTGNLQSEVLVENGVGMVKTYYESGQLLSISYQKNGKVFKQKNFPEKRSLMSETDKIAFDKKRSEQRMEFWNDVSEVITTGIQLYYDYSGTKDNIGTYTLPTTLQEATDQIMSTIEELIPND